MTLGNQNRIHRSPSLKNKKGKLLLDKFIHLANTTNDQNTLNNSGSKKGKKHLKS